MKNETARREIESLDYYLQNHTNDYSEESHMAMMMAIKALEQQPCEDTISRQAVKNMLTAEWTKYMPMELDVNLSFVLEKISELPSVMPQPKMGKWIKSSIGGAKICSICQSHMGLSNFKYCPNCGAKMQEVE